MRAGGRGPDRIARRIESDLERPRGVSGELIGGLVGLVLGILGTWAATHFSGRLRASAGRGLVDRMLDDARGQAEGIRRQAELAGREEALHRRQTMEAEAEEARKAIQMQLQAMAAQVIMLQQQINMLRTSQVQKEALESVSKAVSSAKHSGHGNRTNAEGVPIGGTVDVQA